MGTAAQLEAPGQAQGTLELHDLSNDCETLLWQGMHPIREISFTPDGSRLVAFTFGAKPAAVVFDLAKGIAVSTNTSTGAIFLTGIARLSSDGKRIFLSQTDGPPQESSVKCLEPESGRELWTADLGSNDGVTAMALSPDDRVLVTATGFVDAPIGVWDAETGKRISRLEGHTGWVGELTFSRDGRWLASAAADQTIRLWETSQWTEARVLRGHEDEVCTVAFTPDGRMLASGSKDGAVLLWDLATRQSNYGHRLLSPEVVAVAEYAPGLAIAFGADLQGLAALRLDDSSQPRGPVATDFSGPVTYLPPNLVGSYDQTNVLRIMEYREAGTELFRETVGTNLVCHPRLPAAAIAYSRDHRLIAWGEKSGVVQVAGFGQPVRRWQWASELHWPTPRVFSPDGKLLVLSGQGGERGLEVREGATGKLLLHSDFRIITSGDIPEHKSPVRFADAGRKLVAARQWGGDGIQLALWDLTRPEHPPILFDEPGTLTDLSVSPDGRWVALCSQAGIAVLFEAASMKRRHELPGSMQAVFSLAFSPDSRCLATGAGGRDSIKLWQVETGQELLTLPSKNSLRMDIAFAEGGNTLLLGRFGHPHTWQMWHAPSWEVIHTAEAKEQAKRNQP